MLPSKCIEDVRESLRRKRLLRQMCLSNAAKSKIDSFEEGSAYSLQEFPVTENFIKVFEMMRKLPNGGEPGNAKALHDAVGRGPHLKQPLEFLKWMFHKMEQELGVPEGTAPWAPFLMFRENDTKICTSCGQWNAQTTSNRLDYFIDVAITPEVLEKSNRHAADGVRHTAAPLEHFFRHEPLLLDAANYESYIDTPCVGRTCDSTERKVHCRIRNLPPVLTVSFGFKSFNQEAEFIAEGVDIAGPMKIQNAHKESANFALRAAVMKDKSGKNRTVVKEADNVYWEFVDGQVINNIKTTIFISQFQ